MSETTGPNGGSNKIDIKRTNKPIDLQKYGMKIVFGDYEVKDPEKIKMTEGTNGTTGTNGATGGNGTNGSTPSVIEMGNSQEMDSTVQLQAINNGEYVGRRVDVKGKETKEEQEAEQGQEKE